jgi:ABC-type arginine transport system ATPase subunit
MILFEYYKITYHQKMICNFIEAPSKVSGIFTNQRVIFQYQKHKIKLKKKINPNILLWII